MMAGFRRLVALTAVVGAPSLAAGQSTRTSTIGPELVMPTVSASATTSVSAVPQTASLTSGWIEGQVTDDRAHPIVGAAVTAQGRDLLLAQTDRAGHYTFHSVPPGTYLVRVQGRGFAASKREFLHVMPARGTRHVVQLRKLSTAVMTQQPRVAAAGASLGQVTASGSVLPDGGASGPASGSGAGAAEQPPVAEKKDDHDHSATAWRLRHLKRPVLRDASNGYIQDEDPLEGLDFEDSQWRERRRFDLPAWSADMARATAGFLSGTALSGRVQLLTASAFDKPFEALSSPEMPAGIAYFTVGAPVSDRSTWAVEAAVTQGDVSSWFVAGSYARIIAESHGIDVASSYTRQRYHGANPAALAVFREDTSRNAGGVQVYDRWTVSSRVLLTYGGRYDHYDYLESPGMFSPSVTLSLSPADRTWIRASVSQQMSAPGAEEFVPQSVGAFALPPTRTFAPLGSRAQAGAGEIPSLGRERVRHVGLSLEREFAAVLFQARHFRQEVDDQLVTIFGVAGADGTRADLGHYWVGRAGSFVASGWGFGVSRMVAADVRGSVEYRTASADWINASEQLASLTRWAPSAIRPESERLHDVTAKIESEIKPTATRVVAAYRISTAYTRADLERPDPGNAARFDVQIHQGLPFLAFTRARWELLLAVRNLFHELDDPTASLYDELLVVRPPKRVLGGVTVQF